MKISKLIKEKQSKEEAREGKGEAITFIMEIPP
jgi:hypothetical protein